MAHLHPLYLVAGIVVVALVYVARCAWFPLANCWRCKGEGKFKSWAGRGKTWRLCRRCRGTGSRIRPGRIVWDKIRTARTKAKNTG